MITLDAIRDCLEGVVPSAIATCAADGTPNVAYLSQVEYVDRAHVALSFQFFNKTRANVLANPRAVVGVLHPVAATMYRLELAYLRTETSGPVFERMRAKLASIASHTGMTDVFRLQGADIYRVERIEHVAGPVAPPSARDARLGAVRAISDDLTAASTLGELVDAFLDGLVRELGVTHASVQILDRTREVLFTVGSRGYDAEGIGAEVALGVGAIGIAGAHRTPIRMTQVTAEYAYARAIRGRTDTSREIPMPGLFDAKSQLAVPLVAGDVTLGVVFVESRDEWRFSYADEDALVVLARQLALAMQRLDDAPGDPSTSAWVPFATAAAAAEVRHYAQDDSVFVDGTYVIKGVAGAILWKALRGIIERGRDELTNKELRLDRTLGLPEIGDNLEARILLLERRLRERDVGLRLERTGRGRFRIVATRTLTLVEA